MQQLLLQQTTKDINLFILMVLQQTLEFLMQVLVQELHQVDQIHKFNLIIQVLLVETQILFGTHQQD